MKKSYENLESYKAANIARINYEIALADDKASEIAKNKAALDEALKVFNEKIIKLQYDEILIDCQTDPESKNPVLKAINLGSLVAYRCKPNKKTGMVEWSERMVMIDLIDLANFARKVNKDANIFNDRNWVYWVEALNHAFLNERVQSGDIKSFSDRYDNFKMSETAKELQIDFSTLAGKTACLQSVMDAILFAPYIDKEGNEDATKNKYKVITKHIKMLDKNYSSWSNKTKLGVVLPTDGAFRQQLMRILFAIVTGEEFKGE